MDGPSNPREQLAAVIEALEQERAVLLAQGRALTPEEQARVALLAAVVVMLRDALATLQEGTPVPPVEPVPAATLRDGRYDGGNHALYVDLRVDEAVSGVISADLYRLGGTGRDYVASVRTPPGERIETSQGSWMVIGEDSIGGRATGVLSLAGMDGQPEKLSATLWLEEPLNGLPLRSDIAFLADWAGGHLRVLGLEVETEQDVPAPAAFPFGDGDMTFERCLADAGFDLIDVGLASQIPSSAEGWHTSVLHTLMSDFAEASVIQRAWELHLLLLSRSTRSGLLGIMFDTTASLPRQGAAVFASEIRGIPGIAHDRKLIQTTVHELGHALNLAHRFEREVGRADSLSHMAYDWRYKGGGFRDEFWSNYAFTFDADELAFLRHAPRAALIPGGAPFHSIRYWADGTGGYSPYVPEVTLEGFRLTLHPPETGPLFAFAQPVFLEVRLENLTGRAISYNPALLDPKAGFLEILIRRRHEPSPTGLADAELFVPIIQRCYDFDERTMDTLPPGGVINNNLNLVYGSAGFSFAEPGEYDVTPLVVIYDSQNEREIVIRGEDLRIRVAHPQSIDEERDAMELFQDEVGAYLALGGSDALGKAHDALGAVRERRQRDEATVRDPLVATIVRAEGINAGRAYIRYRDGRYHEEAANPDRAAELLGMLDDQALQAFDRHTATHTERLAASYRGAQE